MREKQILRFETDDQLDCLEGLLGLGALFGVRRRRPKLGHPKSMQPNEHINVVVGNSVVEAPFNLHTDLRGVDLEFDKKWIHVSIRYERYTLKVSDEGVLIGCPSSVLASTLEHGAISLPPLENGGLPSNIRTDSMFSWESKLLQITKILKGALGTTIVRALCLHVEYEADKPQEKIGKSYDFQDLSLVSEAIASYN